MGWGPDFNEKWGKNQLGTNILSPFYFLQKEVDQA